MSGESRLPTIKRTSPTVIEMTIPCKMHGDHTVHMVSEDDVAEVIAAFVAQYVFEHGYKKLYAAAVEWDDIPF